MLALEPANMLLGVKLKPDPIDQIKLGFEEIDVMLLVLHQAFEQIARHVVLDAVAVGRRFLIKVSRADLDAYLDRMRVRPLPPADRSAALHRHAAAERACARAGL